MLRWLLVVAAVTGILIYAINRDIHYEKAYNGDLRNRVTGSRMIKDGRSPYFYKWKTGDGLRYYDPGNFDSVRPSNMTSTPVLYRLLSPLVEQPEARISEYWLVIEYLMLGAITLFAFLTAPTTARRQAVVLVFGAVLLTNGWKEHTANGQTYLCIPFFAMLFLVFWKKKDHPANAILAGCAAACLILIRVNTLLFFPPFWLLVQTHPRRWWLFFCIPMALFGGWALTSTHERGLWRDYFSNVNEAIRINQNLHPAIQHNDPDPRYPRWEGIDTLEADHYMKTLPAKIYSENGNFFVLFQGVFHRQLSVATMGWLSFGGIGLLALLFYFRCRPFEAQDTPWVAIFGFCLFMIADLFSPVYRHQYYTVQWILPLMLAATQLSPRKKAGYGLLLLCLLLWCFHLPFLKMQNTLAEYGILAVLLAMALDLRTFRTQNPPPVSLPK
ncbi:MAG TPA: glycosyltransferase 87 family protein [Puia sp.]|uniref:glycosyltransferase 87 family protein n=1 Tax=Puia sp. TaxID=2045100 RepID=UPI002C25E8C3|nr:glycosyltransferase 87 family protein [Puia sp.]HVU96196.1 glycosyltransferase 87 family protein [Puia sp.]